MPTTLHNFVMLSMKPSRHLRGIMSRTPAGPTSRMRKLRCSRSTACAEELNRAAPPACGAAPSDQPIDAQLPVAGRQDVAAPSITSENSKRMEAHSQRERFDASRSGSWTCRTSLRARIHHATLRCNTTDVHDAPPSQRMTLDARSMHHRIDAWAPSREEAGSMHRMIDTLEAARNGMQVITSLFRKGSLKCRQDCAPNKSGPSNIVTGMSAMGKPW